MSKVLWKRLINIIINITVSNLSYMCNCWIEWALIMWQLKYNISRKIWKEVDYENKYKKNKTCVINDPLGQTQSHASSEHWFLLFCFSRFEKWGRTYGQHVRKQLSLPVVTLDWPSGSKKLNLIQIWIGIFSSIMTFFLTFIWKINQTIRANVLYQYLR